MDDIAIPTLPSRSIDTTVAFYRALGFDGGPHAANPAYAILRRGTLELHFFRHDGLDPSTSSFMAYLRVSDADALYGVARAMSLPAQGIPRLDPLADKPWGMREFALVDPDGTLIRVGQPL